VKGGFQAGTGAEVEPRQPAAPPVEDDGLLSTFADLPPADARDGAPSMKQFLVVPQRTTMIDEDERNSSAGFAH